MSEQRVALAATLRDVEAALTREPTRVDLLWTRARTLDFLGRSEDAKQAYLDVIRVDSKHVEALTGLGALLARTGYRAGAKTAFLEALQAQPSSPNANCNLAILLADEGDPLGARRHYERALELDPNSLNAHRGLAILLLRLGEVETAQRHGRIGFSGGADAWPYRGEDPPVSLLFLLSAVGGNLPVDALIDDTVFLKWTLVTEFFDPEAELPAHDLVFNGIGDADRCSVALEAAAKVVARTSAPVLNSPARVQQTGRAANAQGLRDIAGVVTARTAECSRELLTAPDAFERLVRDGFTFPLLLRSPGFHTGEYFVRVDQPESFREAVEQLPGSTLLVMQFIDTRGPDQQYRKYRVMMVDGQLYPVHLAVSGSWKVHYFSADMADHAEYRAEDEAFLNNMPGVLGENVLRALEQIQTRLGLDYGGIDFAIDGNGRVVVFEANATMVIVPPGEDERWRYRIAPLAQLQHAVRQMLLSRAKHPAEQR